MKLTGSSNRIGIAGIAIGAVFASTMVAPAVHAAPGPSGGPDKPKSVKVAMRGAKFDPEIAKKAGYQVVRQGENYLVSKGGQSRTISPNVVVPGDCGTAFLYLARVDGTSARATYGFENLARVAVSYSQSATFFNEDRGTTANDLYIQAPTLTQHIERAVTKETGSGEVLVSAKIRTFNIDFSSCESLPGLYDTIYVY